MELSTTRLTVMRAGYAFMAIGIALVKWPILLHDVRAIPVMAGVVTCMLTAVSLLALLGLRYPAAMLPVLLFEAAWKLIWIGSVAVPGLVAGELDAASREVLVNCSLVVVVLAVIPWRYAWQRYARTPATPLRSAA